MYRITYILYKFDEVICQTWEVVPVASSFQTILAAELDKDQIGDLHDDFIWLQLPEFFAFSFYHSN